LQLDEGLRKAVVLDSMSSDSFKSFSNNSESPLIMHAYVYGVSFRKMQFVISCASSDIQNAEDVLLGAKPIMIERGPYVYHVSPPRSGSVYRPHPPRQHYKILHGFEWSEDRDVVDYKAWEHLKFIPEESGLPPPL